MIDLRSKIINHIDTAGCLVAVMLSVLLIMGWASVSSLWLVTGYWFVFFACCIQKIVFDPRIKSHSICNKMLLALLTIVCFLVASSVTFVWWIS